MLVDVPMEVAKQYAQWGTFGKGGMEHCKGTCPDHQLRWVRLIDCETDHLKAILANCPHISSDYEEIIISILTDRGEVNPLENRAL